MHPLDWAIAERIWQQDERKALQADDLRTAPSKSILLIHDHQPHLRHTNHGLSSAI